MKFTVGRSVRSGEAEALGHAAAWRREVPSQKGQNGFKAEGISESLADNVIEELRKALKPFGGIPPQGHPVLVRIKKYRLFVIVGCLLPAVALTPRQRDVLRLIGLDLGNAGIARRLSVSENTVHYHVSRLLTKFGISGRTALVRRAAMYGLLVDGDSPEGPSRMGS